MLTPKDLENLYNSKLVKMYKKLNQDIVEDLIKKLERNSNITSAEEWQMKILLETDGTKVFEETLEKTGRIDSKSKKEVKDIYNRLMNKDLGAYKPLFKYRNKDFKLSEGQIKILNSAIKQTNNTLKNFTNTIAFNTQELYVNAVDQAYLDVVTGGLDYNTAIKNTVNELKNKGITLKDSAGRNIKLETAVRRNILTGIKQTANRINEDIDKELGCDGYQVTAHIGARPSHAEAQGKIYAKNKKDAIKYGVGLWSDVEDLWQEPNCRHTYYGVILGISGKEYTNKELNDMKNLKVKYNGKDISYYDATQLKNRLKNNKSSVKNRKMIKELNKGIKIAEESL